MPTLVAASLCNLNANQNCPTQRRNQLQTIETVFLLQKAEDEGLEGQDEDVEVMWTVGLERKPTYLKSCA